MKLKDKSNAEQKRKIHNDIVADSNRDAHRSDVAKEMNSRTKFSIKGAKYDGRSRPSNDLYKKNYDEIFRKDKEEEKDKETDKQR